jgi:hypothetical protein
MEGAFKGCTDFSADISGWDVAHVTDISGAFAGCANFTGEGLRKWRPSLTNMREAFMDCSYFNADLSGWDVRGLGNPAWGTNGNVTLSTKMHDCFRGTAFRSRTLGNMIKAWAKMEPVPRGIDLGNLDRTWKKDNINELQSTPRRRKLSTKPVVSNWLQSHGIPAGEYIDIDVSISVHTLRSNGWVIDVDESSDYSDFKDDPSDVSVANWPPEPY